MHQQISKGTSSVLESVLYIDKQRQGLTNMEGSLAFRERTKNQIQVCWTLGCVFFLLPETILHYKQVLCQIKWQDRVCSNLK